MNRNVREIPESGTIEDRIQIENPVTGLYVKMDTRTGRVVGHKKTKGAYKRIGIKTI